mmetsp:Transcript_102589/g.319691  ORF Transcript_102589/g.319691 Transcript_102589/m.319691 type:complete len:605 (-) Transcript_102589:20-1834(-)
MNVHIQFSGLLLVLGLWSMPMALTQSVRITHYEDWFGAWSRDEVFQVANYVALSWVAGLVTQQMNTVVKAIVQSIATVMAVMLADPILEDRYRFDLRAAPEIMLAIIYLMSAIIFQTGRILIHSFRRVVEPTGSHETLNEAVDGPGGIFSTAPSMSMASRARRYTVTLPSRSGLVNYACILLYILVDVGRTLLNSYALTTSAINPETLALLGFVFGVVIACGLTLPKEGFAGMREAWQPGRICESMPAASLFAVGQCLTSFAYAFGISPALANVLGKIYTPLAAFGGRCIMDRYYSWLEYFAIVILTLASLTFGYLKESGVETGLKMGSSRAMLCALGSAVFAAFGSLAMEKILQGKQRRQARQGDSAEEEAGVGEAKGKREPYRIQKIRLDFGSALFSLGLLPVISMVSTRPKDSLWVTRPWDSGSESCAHCEPRLGGLPPHWPWSPLNHSCDSSLCTGECSCTASLVVGWQDPMLVAALAVNVAQGWLIGMITKQFSTIHRAIADAFSTLLLYWVGDPCVNMLVKGVRYLDLVKDLCLDMVSFIVPLSTVIFMVATSQMKEVMVAADADLTSESSDESDSGSDGLRAESNGGSDVSSSSDNS